MKIYSILVSAFLICGVGFANSSEKCAPLLSLGGGYWDAGSNHSSSLYQIEYKWGDYFLWIVRPQVGVFTPAFHSVMFYGGIAADFYVTDHIVFSPNFCPGIYLKGNGKDLGCVIEFRSALEVAYEFTNCVRIGAQFFHVSNAHLSSRNPGANAIVGFIAFPLDIFQRFCL